MFASFATNVVVHEGKLSTLKRFKDEVKEVQSGPGMRPWRFEELRRTCVSATFIECFYRVETIQRSL